jgi:hypothetical protein
MDRWTYARAGLGRGFFFFKYQQRDRRLKLDMARRCVRYDNVRDVIRKRELLLT